MMQFSGYVLALLLSALITGSLYVVTHHRQQTAGSREFGYLLAALTAWSLAAALEGMSTHYGTKIFWTVLSYPGSQTTAVFFFLFVLRYTKVPHFSGRWSRAALFVPAAVSIVMAATNTWHGWLWPSITQASHAYIGEVIIFAHGPWFWVEVAYAYALITAGLVLLVRAIFIYPQVFSAPNCIMLVVAFLPLLFSIAYSFGAGTPRVVDLTPVAFSVSGALLALSIFRYGFLRLAPVSRQEILERLWAGILLVNSHGSVIYANHSFQRMFYIRKPLPGQCAWELLGEWPELVEKMKQLNLGSLGSEKSHNACFIFRVPVQQNEGALWYEMRVQPLYDLQGSFSGSLVIANDITGRKQVEDTLRDRQEFYATLNSITAAALEASDLKSMAQILADQMGALFHADGCYIALWNEVDKHPVPLAAFGPFSERFLADGEGAFTYTPTMTQSVLEAHRALVAEDVLHSPYIHPVIAERYPVRTILGLPLIAGGRRLGAALITFSELHPITADEVAFGEQASAHISLAMLKNFLLDEAREANRRAEEINRQLQLAMTELDEMVVTDPLTGAYNRNRFDELIPYEMSQVERYGQPLSIIMLDADRYKQVNDTYGHNVGDKVLIELVAIINSNIRKSDTLIRWGGDEFLIICPNIGLEQAKAMAEKLQTLVASRSFPGAGSFTVSIGVAAAKPGEHVDEFLSRADEAVYQAKRSGRNRVEALL